MKRAILMIVLWFGFSVSNAQADGMRCGTKLVVAGDTKIEVLSKCGEPDFKETVAVVTKSKEVNIADRANAGSGVNLHSRHSNASTGNAGGITLGTETTEAIEEWSYNQGPTKFIKVLTFRGGRLESVQETERGYSDE